MVVTLRSLKEEIRNHKPNNDQTRQGQGSLQISNGHGDGTNGRYVIRSPSRHISDIYGVVRDDRLMDIANRKGNEYMYYSHSDFDRRHDCHRYHPYRTNDKGYFLVSLRN